MLKFLVLLFGLWAISSYAEELSGQEFYELCTGSDSHYGSCLMYVAGFRKGWSLYETENARVYGVDCLMLGIPVEASNRQILDVYLKHLKDKPAARDDTAANSLLKALTEHYTCDET